MNTHKTIFCTVTVVGLVLLACLIGSLCARMLSPLPPNLITISFAGYTNAVNGQAFARFAVSNQTRSRVVFQDAAPAVYTNGQWRMMSSAGPAIFLQSRGQSVVTVQNPNHGEVWRLSVSCGVPPSLLGRQLKRIWQVLPWRPAFLENRIEHMGNVDLRLVQSDIRRD